MSYINEMKDFNNKFVDDKQYEEYLTTKFPKKKTAILTCMDTRLIELLPAALNIKNGDVKILKSAGAFIVNQFGSIMRNLLVAVYVMGVEDIIVIGHRDCGMQGMGASNLIPKMKERGINDEQFDYVASCGINVNEWLNGVENTEYSIAETVNIIKDHPLIPKDVCVHGFIMDPHTGKLDEI